MNELLLLALWVIGIFLVVVTVGVGGTIWLRAISPHSRAMAAAQARVNRRTTTTTTPPSEPQPPKRRDRFERVRKWLATSFWNLLFGFAGLAILIWGFLSTSHSWETPTLGAIVVWSREHWLWILALAGILAVLAELNAATLGRATKVVRSTLLWGLAALFIGIPVLAGFTSTGNSSTTNTAQIPLASAPQSSWPKLTAVAGGEFAHITVPPKMHVVMIGNNFRLHNVYQDGHECAFGEHCVDGPLTSVYATNEATEENIISYAFAPDVP